MAKIKLTDLYKSLKDKPLNEQGDIETWNSPSGEIHKIDHNKQDLSGKYDPGNEPLEIQYHEDQQLYYIDVEDIEAYVSGETVWATDPDRGGDDIEVNRENSDVSGVSEDELEDFMVSGDRSADDVDDDDRFSGMDDMFGADLEEGACTEEEIAEGTCGYAPDGEVDVNNTRKMKPASPARIKIISLQERFKKLANIK